MTDYDILNEEQNPGRELLSLYLLSKTNNMKKVCKVFLPFLAVALTATTLSCNDEAAKKEEPKLAGNTTMTTTPAASPEAFKPFDMMEVTQTVKDYAAFRPFFDKDSVNRKASGIETAEIGRADDNPNNVAAFFIISDLAKAKSFSLAPALKQSMKNAGVTGIPGINYFHVLRFNPDAKEENWVVIKHKVKDYDTWIKAYDAETTAKRNTEGMNDVLIARDIEDPNMVEIIFDVTDIVKAKAAIASAEKKKLMESAGLDGKPEITFYSTAE